MDDVTTDTSVPAETPAAPATPSMLKAGIEAILFTCDEPVTLHRLKDIFPEAKPDEIREAIGALKAEYDGTGRAFSLEEIAGGYQLLTRQQHADIIAKLKKAKADRKLSAAAL